MKSAPSDSKIRAKVGDVLPQRPGLQRRAVGPRASLHAHEGKLHAAGFRQANQLGEDRGGQVAGKVGLRLFGRHVGVGHRPQSFEGEERVHVLGERRRASSAHQVLGRPLAQAIVGARHQRRDGVGAIDGRVHSRPASLPPPREHRVELGLFRSCHRVERPAERGIQAEHHVGEVVVAKEDDRGSRRHAGAEHVVLEGEVPVRGAGAGLHHPPRLPVDGAAHVGRVDARSQHRVADEDDLGADAADVFAKRRVVRQALTEGLERRKVTERRAGRHLRRDRTQAQWHEERDDGDEDQVERARTRVRVAARQAIGHAGHIMAEVQFPTRFRRFRRGRAFAGSGVGASGRTFCASFVPAHNACRSVNGRDSTTGRSQQPSWPRKRPVLVQSHCKNCEPMARPRTSLRRGGRRPGRCATPGARAAAPPRRLLPAAPAPPRPA